MSLVFGDGGRGNAQFKEAPDVVPLAVVKWSNTDRHQVKSNNTQNEVQNEQASQKEIFKAVQAGFGKVGYRTAVSDRRGSSQSGHKRQLESDRYRSLVHARTLDKGISVHAG